MPGQDEEFEVEEPLGASAYSFLSKEFENTHHDNRGGVELEYITGEQCATRLNTVLGPFGWSGRVLEHGYNEEANEYWVLYELTVHSDENGSLLPQSITRQQFGSQKVKRRRNDNSPLDIGFDLKGATTDAMKKCATLIGVGLYLSSKEPREDEQPAPQQQQRPAGNRQAAPQQPTAARTAAPAKPTPITTAPSAQQAKTAPERAINRGEPEQLGQEDWDKYFTACHEHLGLDSVGAIMAMFPGNMVDVGQLLHAYNTDLQGMYLLTQWVTQGNAPPPYVDQPPTAPAPTKAATKSRR